MRSATKSAGWIAWVSTPSEELRYQFGYQIPVFGGADLVSSMAPLSMNVAQV